MKQKTKKLFNRFGRANTRDLAELKQAKILKTQLYLQERRSYGVPQAPMGFKPRSSSAYFFSNYR